MNSSTSPHRAVSQPRASQYAVRTNSTSHLRTALPVSSPVLAPSTQPPATMQTQQASLASTYNGSRRLRRFVNVNKLSAAQKSELKKTDSAAAFILESFEIAIKPSGQVAEKKSALKAARWVKQFNALSEYDITTTTTTTTAADDLAVNSSPPVAASIKTPKPISSPKNNASKLATSNSITSGTAVKTTNPTNPALISIRLPRASLHQLLTMEILDLYLMSLDAFITRNKGKNYPEEIVEYTGFANIRLRASNAAGNIVALQPFVGNTCLPSAERTKWAIHALNFVSHSLWLNLINPGYDLAVVAAAEWLDTLTAAWENNLPTSEVATFKKCGVAIMRLSKWMEANDSFSIKNHLQMDLGLFKEFILLMAPIVRRVFRIKSRMEAAAAGEKIVDWSSKTAENSKLATDTTADTDTIKAVRVSTLCEDTQEFNTLIKSASARAPCVPAAAAAAAAAPVSKAKAKESIPSSLNADAKEFTLPCKAAALTVACAKVVRITTLRAEAKEFVLRQAPTANAAEKNVTSSLRADAKEFVVGQAGTTTANAAEKNVTSSLRADAKEFVVAQAGTPTANSAEKNVTSSLRADAKEFVVGQAAANAATSVIIKQVNSITSSLSADAKEFVVVPKTASSPSEIPSKKVTSPPTLKAEAKEFVPPSKAPSPTPAAAPTARRPAVVTARPAVDNKENIVPRPAPQNGRKMTIIRDCLIPLPPPPGSPRGGRTANYFERLAIVNNARKKGLLGDVN